MKLWKAVLFALAVGVVSAAITDAKQEQPGVGERRGNRCFNGRMWLDCQAPAAAEKVPYATRTWELTGISYRNWTDGRVDVIDTEGVCLYVFTRTNESAGIAAVPKTQLPKGAGCQ